MPIPPIAPYRMPASYELPENQVEWRPHAARAALLVHDMQRYFVDFFSPDGPPLTELIGNIRRLRATANDLGMPVLYTAQPGGMTPMQRGLLYDFWGAGMSNDERHTAIVPELAPGPHDAVLSKWRYSAFQGTGLYEVLSRRGRDQLLVCGVYAHIGCLMTANDAFAVGIQPFLIADAMGDFSAGDHQMALDYAARRCAVVMSTGSAVDVLTDATLEPA